ncbi:MAG: TRAP transporter small permease subunit [Alphaproteobacteria bacterium]|nr:MAG: TRAP transporter small permease subunit [Alphaproteobacteria bacterium]
MQGLLRISSVIDAFLERIARLGAIAGLMLAFVVVFDVVTRYFGVPKPFGLNSTQVQEFEYWLHTVLFSLVIGYAYVVQGHVRIDLIRDRLSLRAKYILEIIGCVLFLIPFCLVALRYHVAYAYASFLEGEVSKSVIGLTHLWILKSFLPLLFLLLLMAALSQLIKAVAGLTGDLPADKIAATVGSSHTSGSTS